MVAPAGVRLWSFSGTVELPNDVTKADFEAYLYDAIGTMKGCYNPEEPIFDLDGNTVKITKISRIQKPRKKEETKA